MVILELRPATRNKDGDGVPLLVRSSAPSPHHHLLQRPIHPSHHLLPGILSLLTAGDANRNSSFHHVQLLATYRVKLRSYVLCVSGHRFLAHSKASFSSESTLWTRKGVHSANDKYTTGVSVLLEFGASAIFE